VSGALFLDQYDTGVERVLLLADGPLEAPDIRAACGADLGGGVFAGQPAGRTLSSVALLPLALDDAVETLRSESLHTRAFS
jgi:hypothetical protein